jgi:uncharacterized protein (DUF983 family)
MGKKGEMPFWIVMLIWTLLGLAVVLGIIMIIKGNLFDFLSWLQ